MSNNTSHASHSDPSIANHIEWGFRRESLTGVGDIPLRVNFHPLATEFREWLLRKGSFSVFAEKDRNEVLSIKNPYTYHASVITTILARVINATHAFAISTEPLSAMDADIERIRLYNEQILYTARLCEATIKQLLYCTQIPESYYKKASLGALLAIECRACKG